MQAAVSHPDALPLSSDDYALLVASVTEYAIFLLDTEGRVATWNPGAERIKGYTSEEIVGQHFSRFYSPEDKLAGEPERELAIATAKGRVESEGWRVRKDGSSFWANVVITALRDGSGKLRGFGKVTKDVTERKLAEAQLRRSEERFRLLVERVEEYAIFMLDTKGYVSTWNAGAARIKGYAADEIVGKHFSVFYLEEDVRAGKCDRELAVANAVGRFEDEGWRVRKDGGRFWANVVITAVRDADGKLLGFGKVTRDLTARKEAEETAITLVREQTARVVAERSERELRESEKRYRTLSRRLEIILAAIANVITVRDGSGRILFANGAAAQFFGFDSVDDLLRAAPDSVAAQFDIFDEDGKPFDSTECPALRAIRGETSSRATIRFRNRTTGEESWQLVRASTVLDSAGAPELAVSVWHDLTEGRRRAVHQRCLFDATATLASSLDYERTLSALVNLLVPGLADWCAVHLVEGAELRELAVAPVNRNAAYLQAPSGSDALWNVVRTGSTVVKGVPTLDGQDDEDLAALRSLGLRSVVHVPIRLREGVVGTLSIGTTVSGRRNDEHVVALAEELGRRTGTAIEHARLYRSAQAAAREAEEASRIKDEFLATISHELRTPLNAILGWSSLLHDGPLEPRLAKGIEVIHRNALGQAKIIEDVLDVSRIITGKLRLEAQPVDLLAVTRAAMEVTEPSAVAKRISIDLAAVDERCLVVADPGRLQQVIWNLLSNAVKFTKANGSIYIEIVREGSSFALSVTDSGCGIDPKFMPFVFDRFTQADSSTTRLVGGLGLGLAIVRHLVELHGGSVRASSPGRGKGATFTVVLPEQPIARSESPKPHSTVARPVLRPSVAVALQGVHVLVVDDDLDTRELISEVLASAGAKVDLADSAGAGFDALRRLRPHVVLCDIGMPFEDGYSLIARVRALAPLEGGTVPAIALTAYTRETDRAQALRSGFTAHVAKPMACEQLVSMVAQMAAARE